MHKISKVIHLMYTCFNQFDKKFPQPASNIAPDLQSVACFGSLFKFDIWKVRFRCCSMQRGVGFFCSTFSICKAKAVQGFIYIWSTVQYILFTRYKKRSAKKKCFHIQTLQTYSAEQFNLKKKQICPITDIYIFMWNTYSFPHFLREPNIYKHSFASKCAFKIAFVCKTILDNGTGFDSLSILKETYWHSLVTASVVLL